MSSSRSGGGCCAFFVGIVALGCAFYFLGARAGLATLLGLAVLFVVAARSAASSRERELTTLRRVAAERLRRTNLGTLPPSLSDPAPRKGAWRGGYLQQERYRAELLPLLCNGVATRALVVKYESTRDTEGPDVDFVYAWLDRAGEVQLYVGHESYDAVHAGFGQGQGNIVVDFDAGLEAGKIITVVYDPKDPQKHLVYESLRLEGE